MATYTPTQEDISSQQTAGAWRITSGKFRRGRGEEGTEQLDNIVMLPIRIGIKPSFITNDGKEVPEKLRVEGHTTDGERIAFQVGLSTITCKSLVLGLNLWEQSTYLSFTPSESDKPNQHGKYLTFVRVKECVGPSKWVELRPAPEDWKNYETSDITEAMSSWEIWKNFASGEDPALSPYDALSDWLEAQGFERYAGQAVYDTVLKQAFKVSEVSSLTTEQWGDAPKKFEMALKKYGEHFPKKAAKPEPDEYDPFADE
jgi:hypothetical protein